MPAQYKFKQIEWFKMVCFTWYLQASRVAKPGSEKVLKNVLFVCRQRAKASARCACASATETGLPIPPTPTCPTHGRACASARERS